MVFVVVLLETVSTIGCEIRPGRKSSDRTNCLNMLKYSNTNSIRNGMLLEWQKIFHECGAQIVLHWPV